jgi:Sec7-like guanine-nucleotide exchange factor
MTISGISEALTMGLTFRPSFWYERLTNVTDYLLIDLQQNIYDSIRKREIVMPEEHTGQLGFEYAWKELLTRSRQTGKVCLSNSSSIQS